MFWRHFYFQRTPRQVFKKFIPLFLDPNLHSRCGCRSAVLSARTTSMTNPDPKHCFLLILHTVSSKLREKSGKSYSDVPTDLGGSNRIFLYVLCRNYVLLSLNSPGRLRWGWQTPSRWTLYQPLYLDHHPASLWHHTSIIPSVTDLRLHQLFWHTSSTKPTVPERTKISVSGI